MKRIQETLKLSVEKKPIQRSDWKKLVNCIDYSNKDKISYIEFVNAATEKYRLIIGQNRLNQAFNIVDIDGTISINELKQCFNFKNDFFKTETSAYIEINDEDDTETIGDKKFNFNEFRELMMELVHQTNNELKESIVMKKTPKKRKSMKEKSNHSANAKTERIAFSELNNISNFRKSVN